MRYYLAIDIGASSGRHILGWLEGGEVRTREVFRFPNGMREEDGHRCWDIDGLEQSVREGIDRALEACGELCSFSIDTWGVDYVLLRGDAPVAPCYAYRDGRTRQSIEWAHGIVPFSELYSRTGAQFEPFNTIYQLSADWLAGRLTGVTDYLMMPEYLTYRLTGEKRHEYTQASTTGLLDPETGAFDVSIIDRLGLPRHLFHPLDRPGTPAGCYRGVRAVLCASHDTASAVEGIPMEGDAPYISSGTWSLLGRKIPRPLRDEKSLRGNWSNEGGVGYIRYQRNLMGMWMVNCLREELCPGMPFDQIVAAAEASGFAGTVDANAPEFLAPKSMRRALDDALGAAPGTAGDYFRCAFRSLALSYAEALRQLEENTGMRSDRVYIVGGGARNTCLNRMTEEASGARVIALPIEATALGNLKVQMRAAGDL